MDGPPAPGEPTRASPRGRSGGALRVVSALAAASLLAAPGGHPAPTSLPWGWEAHARATRAAVATLPREMPAFFREAGDQLAFLAPEPDRWRDREEPAADQAWTYDHYINLELVPEGALEAPDRWTYLRALSDAGLDRPIPGPGFLPWAILERYQRLVLQWERWRAAPAGSDERRWLQARILDDAGLLGHFVADGSQPHHTTIHFDGWLADAPNPEGFSTRRGFHQRFERVYVDARVTEDDLRSRIPSRPASVVGAVHVTVRRWIDETHATLTDLYRIEGDVGFDPDGPVEARARDFAADRLAEGSARVAVLWWSAWQESGG